MRLPPWLTAQLRQAGRGRLSEAVTRTRRLLARLRLPTVCESARCPNRGECFSRRTATFLILGDVCTRGCAFCAVGRGQPKPPDEDEPHRLAQAVAELGLKHVVVTSVTRDDLADGGAGHYVWVARTLRRHCPEVRLEFLVPDFGGAPEALESVMAAGSDVLAHNIETVPRLYGRVRRGAGYGRSLELLRLAKEISPGTATKSGLMLGLGERPGEVEAVLSELAQAGCDMLTLGQYLAPSRRHAPVARTPSLTSSPPGTSSPAG